eukprot:scaffold22260_cov63-Phaeocystis_antarctica.AAC.5
MADFQMHLLFVPFALVAGLRTGIDIGIGIGIGIGSGVAVGTRPPLCRLRRRLGPLREHRPVRRRVPSEHLQVRGQVGRQRCIRQQCAKAGRGVELVVVGSRRAQQLVQGVQQVALPEGHISSAHALPANELRPALVVVFGRRGGRDGGAR